MSPAPDGHAHYLWHPELHERSGERLYFVRLVFEPVYPKLTAEDIGKRLAHLNVGSAHVYELIGSHDILFRVWLSGDVREFLENLRLPELRRADYMAVRKIREHQSFNTNGHGLTDVENITAEAVEEINTLISSSPDDPVLVQYVNKGWITKVLPVEGVKFFIAVSASIGSSSSISFDDVLFSHVKTILDGAANVICERSIYAGDGFARLLLMGRFLGSDYFAFMEQVIFKLNDTYMRELFSARTVTAFGSRRDPIFGQEQLTVSLPRAGTLRSVARRSAEQLLEEGEGAHVEVKASAFLNFDRLVDESVPDWSKLRPEFVKAVCGLLNQRNAVAGTLIVGAVETHRYRDWLGGRDAKLPEYGEFTVLGIEEDNPSGNWDKYRRRLEDALDAGITPAPTDFLSISFEEVERDGTRKLMLRLDLQPAHKPFYASNHDGLWVRRGARVIDLHGPERDEFVHELQQR